jgi:hypothetical protein
VSANSAQNPMIADCSLRMNIATFFEGTLRNIRHRIKKSAGELSHKYSTNSRMSRDGSFDGIGSRLKRHLRSLRSYSAWRVR